MGRGPVEITDVKYLAHGASVPVSLFGQFKTFSMTDQAIPMVLEKPSLFGQCTTFCLLLQFWLNGAGLKLPYALC